MRVRLTIFLCSFAFGIAFGCAKQANVTPNRFPIVSRDTWAYQIQSRDGSTDVVRVYVPTQKEQAAMMYELCNSAYVCRIQDGGKILFVIRTRK